jgi:signal peptidase I
VFRSPRDPAGRDAKRLVGLPGEEVVVKDGFVWIDGVKQTPPAEVARITYTAVPGEWPGEPWGSPDRPTRLGDDEYFVLGDFSQRSADSRVYGPVRRADVTGVVSVVFWPVSRWRIIR